MDDLHMYMHRCHVHILVNKSHNNAVITNDFLLLVYVITLLFVLWNSGGGEIPVRPPPHCMQP